MSAIWASWSEQWQLEEKVDFNGIDKRIYIHSAVSTLDVRSELYSAWVRWVALYDNSKFLPAMRNIGGDPIGGGQFAGDMYFLMNGWQIIIDHQVAVSGILYHDDTGVSPFIIEAGGGVTSTVSSLAYAYDTTGVAAPTVSEIWTHNSRTLTSSFPTVPSAAQNASAVWSSTTRTISDATTIINQMDDSSIKLAQIKAILDTMPSAAQTSDAVWSAPVVGLTNTSQMGGWLYKMMVTVPKFLGLK